MALLLLAGCLGNNPPLIIGGGGDVNGSDLNAHYIDANRVCAGDGRLCMDWNGTDGLVG